MGDQYLEDVLKFALESKWEDFPTEVQLQAKLSILDNLGCLLAGTQTPVADIVAQHVLEQYPGTEATILVTGATATCVGATLANTFAGNALDIDDGHNRASGHPGIGVLPAILAMAQLPDAKKTGIEFLTAHTIGVELALRAAFIRHAIYPTYHPSGSWVPIGVAAAGGYLLNLGKDVTREAMGAGEYHGTVGPMMKCIYVPSMVKDGIGWGSMTGVSSVLLARKGFTGIKPIYADAPLELRTRLGTHFEIMDLYYKPFAACRWGHPAITGALKVYEQMKADNFSWADIDSIHVKTFHTCKELYEPHPKDTEEAQYSMTYPVAAALVDGEVGPKQVLPPRLFDKDILDLVDKIEVEYVEEFQKVYPAKYTSEVVVTTKGGKVYESGVVQPKWCREAPPSQNELETKFRWLVTPVLGTERAEVLVDKINRLEEMGDIQELIDLCCK